MPRILVMAALVYGLCAVPASAQQRGDAQEGTARTALLTLAAASVSLQAYDAYSTLSAIRLGAVESNPTMHALVRHPAAFVAVKAGVAASSMVASRQLWKQHHRKTALVLLAITNGTMTAVAIHNASVVRSMRAARR